MCFRAEPGAAFGERGAAQRDVDMTSHAVCVCSRTEPGAAGGERGAAQRDVDVTSHAVCVCFRTEPGAAGGERGAAQRERAREAPPAADHRRLREQDEAAAAPAHEQRQQLPDGARRSGNVTHRDRHVQDAAGSGTEKVRGAKHKTIYLVVENTIIRLYLVAMIGYKRHAKSILFA